MSMMRAAHSKASELDKLLETYQQNQVTIQALSRQHESKGGRQRIEKIKAEQRDLKNKIPGCIIALADRAHSLEQDKLALEKDKLALEKDKLALTKDKQQQAQEIIYLKARSRAESPEQKAPTPSASVAPQPR
jgi:hypothetical protein